MNLAPVVELKPYEAPNRDETTMVIDALTNELIGVINKSGMDVYDLTLALSNVFAALTAASVNHRRFKDGIKLSEIHPFSSEYDIETVIESRFVPVARGKDGE